MKREVLKKVKELGLDKQTVQSCIDNGYLSNDDLLSGNFFISGEGELFNPDTHFEYDSTVYHKEDGFYCEKQEMFFPNSVGCREVVLDNGHTAIWNEDDAFDCPYKYDGIYFESAHAVYARDYIITEDTCIALSEHDAYWCDRAECWYEYSHNVRGGTYVDDYHSGGYKSLNFSNNPTRFIGFEIEKEDIDVKESISLSHFKQETGGLWRKERDGSLDEEEGFELISPTFELDVDKIFEHIRSNDVLVDHINANKSYSCGGHIHLSVKGMTGRQLFDNVKGYIPLLYALYHKRRETSYCKAKSSNQLISDGEKYQAVQVLDNRIEFRIISAVKDVDNLEWRAKLMVLILDNPTGCFRTAYENILKSKDFGSHLRLAYPEAEKYNNLKLRIKDMTSKFENVNFNISKFKQLQSEADAKYNLEKNRIIQKANIDRLIKALQESGKQVRFLTSDIPEDDWMFIGKVKVPFSEGDVLNVVDFKGGCAIKVEGCENYFPLSMFVL
jgi:hypothetical protein